MGKPAGRSLVAMLNVEDKAEFDARNAEADQIINQVRSQPPLHLLPQVYERIVLPHDLPGGIELGFPPLTGSIGPTRPTLNAVFRKLGYRSLCKKTARNNRIELDVDIGPITKRASFFLLMQGFNWSYGMCLGVSGKPDGNDYPILDQDQWRMVCENVGAIADYIEKTVFAPLEQVYPPTPNWFEFTL